MTLDTLLSAEAETGGRGTDDPRDISELPPRRRIIRELLPRGYWAVKRQGASPALTVGVVADGDVEQGPP